MFSLCFRPQLNEIHDRLSHNTDAQNHSCRYGCLYASVEQRDNPELRGRPVVVGSAAARGVVAAASYEAREFGVRSAMPSVTAARRCPDLIFVPPRFDVYKAVSQQIRAIFAEYTRLIEPLSLDEAYLDVTENLKGMEIATEIASEIRERIKQITGLNASAGISYNKFLAKMASDLNKPNGQAVITPKNGPAFVEQLAVKKFHGVGPATAEKMHRFGIETGADLKSNRCSSLPSISASPGHISTALLAASMNGRSGLIAFANRWAPRTRSASISTTSISPLPS